MPWLWGMVRGIPGLCFVQSTTVRHYGLDKEGTTDNQVLRLQMPTFRGAEGATLLQAPCHLSAAAAYTGVPEGASLTSSSSLKQPSWVPIAACPLWGRVVPMEIDTVSSVLAGHFLSPS